MTAVNATNHAETTLDMMSNIPRNVVSIISMNLDDTLNMAFFDFLFAKLEKFGFIWLFSFQNCLAFLAFFHQLFGFEHAQSSTNPSKKVRSRVSSY